jgi:hypothetical protein
MTLAATAAAVVATVPSWSVSAAATSAFEETGVKGVELGDAVLWDGHRDLLVLLLLRGGGGLFFDHVHSSLCCLCREVLHK